MHRSAPALFFCFDRVVIFILASLSAKITARFLGAWKSSLPRSGKEREAAFLIHNAKQETLSGCGSCGFGGKDGSLLEVGEDECPWANPGVCGGACAQGAARRW